MFNAVTLEFLNAGLVPGVSMACKAYGHSCCHRTHFTSFLPLIFSMPSRHPQKQKHNALSWREGIPWALRTLPIHTRNPGVRCRLRRHGHAQLQRVHPIATFNLLRVEEAAYQRDKFQAGPRRARHEHEPSSFLSICFPPYANHHSEFINLCILLGCDYLEPIKGVVRNPHSS